jgi:DNA-binding MarR family transcriptional regulator
MKSPAKDAVTDLILETFRLNGCLLMAGDALVADIGLTSARWQVLGAIALSPVPLPVAHIARNMGLTRQAVQRLANEMERDGLVRFAPNPHHQRAKLVLLTTRGEAAYAAASRRQRPWASSLAAGLSDKQIEAATVMLRTIRQRLEDHPSQGNRDA